MSKLSNLLIDFETSQDFVRLSVILHVFACGALWLLDYHWMIGVSAVLMSLRIHQTIIRHRKPYPEICALSFSRRIWTVIFTDGECQIYNRVHICLDAGFFTLLHFSSPSHRRYLVIFHDQLSHETLKRLYVIARIKK